MVREKLGYAWVNKKYDEWCRLEVETCYDADQNLTTDVNGYAGIRYEYDEQGNETYNSLCYQKRALFYWKQ